MDLSELKPIIEAMIFVSDEPITSNGILLALAEEGVEKKIVKECIVEIEKDWNENPNRGVQLATVAGGYQFRTKSTCTDWLKRLHIPKPMRVSGPALETLAIVAYKQPIVRSEIEKVRGVDSGGVLKTLLEKKLLRIVGRKDEPGQPLLYGTTNDFLEIFNLNTLKELPTLKDVEDLLRERKAQTDSSNSHRIKIEGDEPTEVIEDVEEEEEETEIIRRYSLEEDEDAEKKDMDALGDLEVNLKSLRRLEKDIFPKPKPEIPDMIQGGEDAGEAIQQVEEQTGIDEEVQQGQEGASEVEVASTQDEVAAADAIAADDRPIE
jgi:segregation and condensation protein B